MFKVYPPRKMVRDGQEIEVFAVIVLRNFWEYFVMEKPDKDGVFLALVDGFELEMGSVDFNEIKSHIMTVGSPNDSLAARNWAWKDEVCATS